jgi:hypothetical protein
MPLDVRSSISYVVSSLDAFQLGAPVILVYLNPNEGRLFLNIYFLTFGKIWPLTLVASKSIDVPKQSHCSPRIYTRSDGNFTSYKKCFFLMWKFALIWAASKCHESNTWIWWSKTAPNHKRLMLLGLVLSQTWRGNTSIAVALMDNN